MGIITDKMYEWYEKRLQVDIDTLLPECVKALESKFDFKYNKVPSVDCKMQPDPFLPKDFDPECSRLSNSMFAAAQYDDSKNIIHVNPDAIWPHNSNSIDKLLVYLNTDRYFAYLPDTDLKPILLHELGHRHNDELLISMGKNLTMYRISGDQNGFRLYIEEGICEYFKHDIMNDHFNKSLNEIHDVFEAYTYGYQIIKPILDKYGRDGIKYLFANNPTRYEKKRPKKYQERMLMELNKI